MDFGDRFRTALGFHMSHLGLNAQELSLRAGLNPTAVWHLLNKDKTKGRPRLDTALSLANALGITINEMLEPQIPQNGYGSTTSETKISPEVVESSVAVVLDYVDDARRENRVHIPHELFAKIVLGICLLRERIPETSDQDVTKNIAVWLEAHQVGKSVLKSALKETLRSEDVVFSDDED